MNKIGNYEYVDLGLPSGTLWAVHDIGAKAEGEKGDLFQWQDTEPYVPSNDQPLELYDFSLKIEDYNKKFCLKTSEDKYVYLKYNSKDKQTRLDPEDDAATVLWGSDWCMPSRNDFRELLKFCKIRYDNGLAIFTGPNGNELRFPHYDDQVDEEELFYSECWSSDCDVDDDYEEPYTLSLYMFDASSNLETDLYPGVRVECHSIRPVSKIHADLSFVLPEDEEEEEEEEDVPAKNENKIEREYYTIYEEEPKISKGKLFFILLVVLAIVALFIYK